MKSSQAYVCAVIVLVVVLSLFQSGTTLAQDQTSTTTLTIVTSTVFANQTVTTTSYVVIGPVTVTLMTTQYRTTIQNVTTVPITVTQPSTVIFPVTAISTVHQNTIITSTSVIISTMMVPFKEAYLDANTVFLFMGLMALLLTVVLVNTLRSAIKNTHKKKQWAQPPATTRNLS